MLSPNKVCGFTLVDTMVGMAIALVVLAAGVSGYSLAARGTMDQIREGRLLSYGQAMTEVIQREVQRAGYEVPVNALLAQPACVYYAYGAKVGGFRINGTTQTLEQLSELPSGIGPGTTCDSGSWVAIHPATGFDRVRVTGSFDYDTVNNIFTAKLTLTCGGITAPFSSVVYVPNA